MNKITSLLTLHTIHTNSGLSKLKESIQDGVNRLGYGGTRYRKLAIEEEEDDEAYMNSAFENGIEL